MEDAICDLEASIVLLEKEQKTIEQNIAARKLRIEQLRSQILNQPRESAPSGIRTKARLRKGEGLVAIENVLHNADGPGKTQAQIAQETGISPSSVLRILQRSEGEGKKFVKGQDDLWRKKT